MKVEGHSDRREDLEKGSTTVSMYEHDILKADSLYANEKIKNKENFGFAWVWWLIYVIPALRRLK